MPRAEKISADNFFLEKKQFPIPSVARNGSFFERKKWRSEIFFARGKIFPPYRMYFPVRPWIKHPKLLNLGRRINAAGAAKAPRSGGGVQGGQRPP